MKSYLKIILYIVVVNLILTGCAVDSTTVDSISNKSIKKTSSFNAHNGIRSSIDISIKGTNKKLAIQVISGSAIQLSKSKYKSSEIIDTLEKKAEKKEIILKTNLNAHIGRINDMIITRIGTLVTASDDKTIREWDIKTGKEIRKILGNIDIEYYGEIYDIALNIDKNILAVGGNFGSHLSNNTSSGDIRLYSYSTGHLIKILKSHEESISGLSFSSDGKFLISSGGKYLKIWDIEKNKLHSTYLGWSAENVKIIKKENKYFAIRFDGRHLSLYDMQLKKEIKKLKSSTFGSGFSIKVLSSNRIDIAVGTDDGRILIFNDNFKLIKKINTKTSEKIEVLKYSKDGKRLVVNTSIDTILYNVDKEYREINKIKNKSKFNLVEFIDNKTIVTTNKNHELTIYNVESFKIKNKIKHNLENLVEVGLNNNKIVYKIKDNILQKNIIKSIDLNSFLIQNNKEIIKKISKINKNWSLSSNKDKNIIIKKDNKEIAIIPYEYNYYGWYHNYIIAAGDYGSITIYNKNGEELYSLVGHTDDIVLLSISNNKLISYGLDRVIRIWDLSKIIISKPILISCEEYNKKNTEFASSNSIVYKNKKGQEWTEVFGEKILDKEIVKIIIPELNKIGGQYSQVNKSEILLQHHKIYNSNDTCSPYIKIRLNAYDMSADVSIYSGVHSDKELEVLYKKLKTSKDIIESNELIKKTLNIFPLLNLVILKNNEYIAYTNEGFFTASKNGSKYIGYHINQGPKKEAEYITVDALYNTFYRPDLIQKSLKGESLKKYAKNINIDKLLQDGLAPEVHILTKINNTKKQDMDLKVQVCPKGKGGYDNLTLLINDTPVSIINTSRALKLKRKSKRDDCFIYDQTISLTGGKNRIGFKATNKVGNIESKPDFLEVTFDDTNLKKKLRSKLAKISGTQNINDLHILAIAVNKYKDKELQLNYSINDATQMLKIIQTVSKPLFNKVHTYKLFDQDVTKQNIKEIFKNIKSTREDVFLLYIAGHGITDQYNGNYYYIPYDFISKDDEKAVQNQGVGQRDLMLGLSKITALKSLVLLDTCNSGSFVEANMQKTTTNRLAKATGRATISASSKSQVALEGYKGHGVFTYTLLEALKGKGYKNDSKITINELSDYVEDILPNRTNNKWGYRQIPQSSMYGVDFNIGEK